MCGSLLQINYFYPTQWLKDQTDLRSETESEPFPIQNGWWRGLQNHPMAIYHKSKLQVRTYHPVTTNKGGGREVPGPPWRVIRISHTVLKAQTLWMLWNYFWTVCGLGRTIWESVGTQLHFFFFKTDRKEDSFLLLLNWLKRKPTVNVTVELPLSCITKL